MDDPTMERLFNAAPVPLLVLDPQLTMIAATDEYLASTMTTREAIIGRHVLDAFPDNAADPDKVLVKSLETVLQTGRSDSVPVQGYDIPEEGELSSEFTKRFWSVINTPVANEDGSVAFIIHRADDVTGVVSMHADTDSPVEPWSALTQAAMLKRSTDLQRANALLREADSAKNEFLSRMSHELRTPLNAIIGFAQLLAMSDLTANDHESAEHILKAGRHLLSLINDVLDLSGIESGRLSLSLEAVNLAEVLTETVQLLNPSAAARAISLTFSQARDVFVHADRQRLKQVLLNLGSNAIKYNREGGRVSFVVSESAGTVEIAVIDDGPGITPELQQRLFTPFDRLGADASSIEGTGLGLALSRSLAEAMGATIRVESELGFGSNFSIRLDEAEPSRDEEPALAAELHLHRRLGTGTVLYVEDNLANVSLMERILERFPSIELLTAMQGGLAIEMARHHVPALVLLDLNLPDLSGEIVLARLKADSSTRAIPIVVVSADASERQIERMRRAGADSYLTKPFDLAELVSILETHLGR